MKRRVYKDFFFKLRSDKKGWHCLRGKRENLLLCIFVVCQSVTVMDKAWFWNSFEISRHAAICKVLLSSGILSQHLDFINIWKETLIRRNCIGKHPLLKNVRTNFLNETMSPFFAKIVQEAFKNSCANFVVIIWASSSLLIEGERRSERTSLKTTFNKN